MAVVVPQGFEFNDEPYQGLFEMLAGGNIHQRNTATDASINSDHRGTPVQLPHGASLDVVAHATTQALYPINIEHLQETLDAMRGEHTVQPLMETLQSARTAVIGSVHYPHRDVLDAVVEHGMDWRQADGNNQSVVHQLCQAVWSTALGEDTSTVATAPLVLDIAERYGERIQSAILDPNPGAMLALALDLAAELRTDPDAEPADEPGDEPDDSDSDGSGGGGGGSGEDDSDSDGAGNSTPPPSRERKVEAERKRLGTQLKRADTRADNEQAQRPEAAQGGGKGIIRTATGRIGVHRVDLKLVPTQPTVLCEAGRLLAKDYNTGAQTGPLARSGAPTSKVWQMGLGNTRVFRGPPPQRGKVATLLDMSGSMYCWCSRCTSRRSWYTSEGYLMMQIAAIIAQCNESALSAGFCDERTIVPLDPGTEPACKLAAHLGSSTPTCVALDWLRHSLGADADGALAVLITDGSPSACSGGRSPDAHTKELANELYQSGMRFAVVLVGEVHDEVAALYPAAITARVTSMTDLRNVQVILDTL